MSSYIINRSAQKYGGRQEEYLVHSQWVIKNAVGRFREAVYGGENLIGLFHRTLDDLAEQRQQIALKHGTKQADRFGLKREFKSSGQAVCLTALATCYEEYGEKTISFFQSHLGEMKHNRKKFLETQKKIEVKECLGRSSYFDLSVFHSNIKELGQYMIVSPAEECPRIFSLLGLPVPEVREERHARLLELLKDGLMMKRLSEVSPADYEKMKMTECIQCLKEHFEDEPKSGWALLTNQFEINQKMYPISQYLTWFYCDGMSDPIQMLEVNSFVSILHQDPSLIDEVLQDAAQVFERMIRWNREEDDLLSLMQGMALFQYELGHAMPFWRGSSAICEWMERAIYAYHGFDVAYNQKKMVNLEALTSSFPDFVKDYPTLVSLMPVS